VIIVFGTEKLRKTCNSLTECRKKWGPECGKKLMQRLDELRSVNCLAETLKLPGKYHALRANRAGQWSADLRQPLRLIFEPADEPLPLLQDGSADTSKAKIVRILEVTDTHE